MTEISTTIDFLNDALAKAPTALDRARRAVGVLRANCRPQQDVLSDPPYFWETMATHLAEFTADILAKAVTNALSLKWPRGMPSIPEMLHLCRSFEAGGQKATEEPLGCPFVPGNICDVGYPPCPRCPIQAAAENTVERENRTAAGERCQAGDLYQCLGCFGEYPSKDNNCVYANHPAGLRVVK